MEIENLKFVEDFTIKLKKKNYESTTSITLDAVNLFRELIKINWWKDFKELLEKLRKIGNKLIDVDPLLFSTGNIIKRVAIIKFMIFM